MYEICKEFDELLSLVSAMGAKGKDVEDCTAELLHVLNQSIKEHLHLLEE